MRIDIAAHILPARYFARLQQIPGFYMAKRVKGIPCLTDLEVRFRIMDAFPGYAQILSLAIPPWRSWRRRIAAVFPSSSIPPEAPTARTTPRSRGLGTTCGRSSDGLTKPAWPWRG